MDRDSPLLGITLMLGFCVLAPLADSLAKLIGAEIPLGQVVLVRFAIQALILWPLFRRGGHGLLLPPRLFGRILWRTLLQVAGISTMFLALRHLPLADAIAIAYVMPFIMLLLGRFVLSEQVGPRRLAACVVGFAGTLMVVQPAFAQLGWVALLPLLVAVIFALYILVTRQIARAIAPIPLQTITGVLGTALLFPIILLAEGSGIAELDPVQPALREGLLLVALGLMGTFSHLLMTWALHFAPASTLAPVQYLEIPFGALFGWLIFSQFPNGLALAGICVVMLAGLYIIWRERMASRVQARR